MNITEMAKVIRSKNSGPFKLTFDIIFKDRALYNRAKDSNAITTGLVSNLYNISEEKVVALAWYDQGKALKITIRRPIPSGSPGDTDVYGCQQHAPLLGIDIP